MSSLGSNGISFQLEIVGYEGREDAYSECTPDRGCPQWSTRVLRHRGRITALSKRRTFGRLRDKGMLTASDRSVRTYARTTRMETKPQGAAQGKNVVVHTILVEVARAFGAVRFQSRDLFISN